jgi:hypothetical protein
MTDEQVKMLADAIHELAKAVGKVGDCIAERFPLNEAVGKGLDHIATAIRQHD